MKRTITILSALVLLCLGHNLHAQVHQSVNAGSATRITCDDGSVSISIGQVFIGSSSSGSGSVEQGIQQPYDLENAILDQIAPVAECQDLFLSLDASGNATITAADIDNGSSDDCNLAALTPDITSFDCSNTGSNIVTLVATDAFGNTDDCSSEVWIEDDIPPEAICRSHTVLLNSTGNGVLTGADVDGGSTDNCLIAARTADITSFTCSDIGTTTVTLLVFDDAGNINSCSSTVEIQDGTPPIALCHDHTIVLDESGTAILDPLEIDNGSTDECAITNYTASQVNFDCADVGSNPVTLTVEDISGNTNSCIANLTVQDLDPPLITCTDVSVAVPASGCFTPVTVPAPTITEACLASLVNDHTGTADASGGYIEGITDVTYTAVDNGGNTAECTFRVTVGDGIPPYTQSHTAACVGTEVVFDLDFPDALYTTWTFGDGYGSSDEDPVHTYTTAGDFTIQVEVTILGCVKRYVSTISISGPVLTVDNIAGPCIGVCDGFIDLSLGGSPTAPVSFAWSEPGGFTASTEDISGLCGGEYSLVVSDAAGCTATGFWIFADPPPLTWSTSSSNVTCGSLSPNGSISISAAGGSGAYSYSIDGGSTFSGSATFTGLPGGSYQTVIRDLGYECDIIADLITISDPGGSISFTPTLTYTAPQGGVADIGFTAVSGGAGAPYSYSLDGGSSFFPVSLYTGIPPGTYTLYVQDAAGCNSAAQTVTVTPALEVMITPFRAACPAGQGPGATMHIVASGGTPPYTYSWSTAAGSGSTEAVTNQLAGVLSYTVTSSEGFTVSSTYDIPEVPPVVLSIDPTLPSSPAASDGQIELGIAVGTTGPYMYLRELDFLPPIPDQANTTGLFTGLVSGVHFVAVQDGNLCLTGPMPVPLVAPSAKVNKEDQPESSSHGLDKWSVEAFPNPFDESALVQFTSPETGIASLEVYSLQGKYISTLFESEVEAGKPNTVELTSEGITAGAFFLQLNFNQQKKKTIKLIHID